MTNENQSKAAQRAELARRAAQIRRAAATQYWKPNYAALRRLVSESDLASETACRLLRARPHGPVSYAYVRLAARSAAVSILRSWNARARGGDGARGEAAFRVAQAEGERHGLRWPEVPSGATAVEDADAEPPEAVARGLGPLDHLVWREGVEALRRLRLTPAEQRALHELRCEAIVPGDGGRPCTPAERQRRRRLRLAIARALDVPSVQPARPAPER